MAADGDLPRGPPSIPLLNTPSVERKIVYFDMFKFMTSIYSSDKWQLKSRRCFVRAILKSFTSYFIHFISSRKVKEPVKIKVAGAVFDTRLRSLIS